MKMYSPSRGLMSFDEVMEDILQYLTEEPAYLYKLIVGTDSQTRETTCFVSAIILHRVGKGARYYYSRINHRKIASLRQRVFYETSMSLEMADHLTGYLASLGREDLKVEIHLDIGNNGDTRDLIKEIVGMVMGSGFDAKIKPFACGATKVADRYTK